ncbi:hypothetical protein C1645_739423 [Glomus cerebriforme]|uniref:Uncharacterized protein n=1 Tax=Glomus cerebriforme TaxID=658196 RepID=A0A397SQY1_9GLOM|nr:hypothetical protein C1645_739423 [Glomus cerebriforme]
MASYLLSDCLEKIFSYLLEEEEELSSKECKTKNYDLTNLYSCTLVSKHWCRMSTPILYSYPFHHFRRLSYNLNDPLFPFSYKCYNYYKLIRTLLNCMFQYEMKGVNAYHVQTTLPSPTFNHISFIRGLIVDKLMFEPQEVCIYYKETWLSEHHPERISTEAAIKIMNRFVKFLFKNCDRLRILEFPYFIKSNELFDDLMDSLTKSNNGENKISDLEEFYYSNYSNVKPIKTIKQIYSILSNNTSTLKSLYNDDINTVETANYLSYLISKQENLRRIVLSKSLKRLDFPTLPNIENIEKSIFKSLKPSPNRKVDLQVLEFRNFCFANMDPNALNSLSLLENLRELKLINCSFIKAKKSSLHYWAVNLTRLETFEFKPAIITITNSNIRESQLDIPQEFLVQLFRSSSVTLTKLVLDYGFDQNIQLTKQIPLCLHSLTYLVMPETIELTPILYSCPKLVYVLVLSIDARYSAYCRSSLDQKFSKTKFPYCSYY